MSAATAAAPEELPHCRDGWWGRPGNMGHYRQLRFAEGWDEEAVQNMHVPGANLSSVDASAGGLDPLDFSGMDFDDACFEDTRLQGANFRGADLRFAHMGGAKLWGVYLTDALLPWKSATVVGWYLYNHAYRDGSELRNELRREIMLQASYIIQQGEMLNLGSCNPPARIGETWSSIATRLRMIKPELLRSMVRIFATVPNFPGKSAPDEISSWAKEMF